MTRPTFTYFIEIGLAIVAAALFIAVVVTANAKELNHLDMKNISVLSESQKLSLVQRGLDFFSGCMVAIDNEIKCSDLTENYINNLKRLVK